MKAGVLLALFALGSVAAAAEATGPAVEHAEVRLDLASGALGQSGVLVTEPLDVPLTGDVSGDGFSDIFWQNTSTGQTSRAPRHPDRRRGDAAHLHGERGSVPAHPERGLADLDAGPLSVMWSAATPVAAIH